MSDPTCTCTVEFSTSATKLGELPTGKYKITHDPGCPRFTAGGKTAAEWKAAFDEQLALTRDWKAEARSALTTAKKLAEALEETIEEMERLGTTKACLEYYKAALTESRKVLA